ncbi:MAG: bifunctional pyr operon transcriptional regulator/uracil phosphoribosyltransferase PyrR [Acidimicrobiia bacterium]|nr:bifunctional pyr operon transcriptional regulator/uracil phosphoribosyltransferase PyrR [Acidimicrobiia bacterium]
MTDADLRRPRAVAFGRDTMRRFVPRTEILDSAGVARAIKRMAHEILERNNGLDDVVIIGLERGGVPIASALGEALHSIEGIEVPVGSVDASFHRDDISTTSILPEVTRIPFSVSDKNVVLCDDVLFTGRTVRAALDAVTDFGRPRSIQLAVMVDRGHRELPIRPDFIGKNLPTAHDEMVRVSLDSVELGTQVTIEDGTREGDRS